MQKTSSTRRVGQHRKVDNSAKRRLALVAVATGAVSTAGAAGATAGAQQANSATPADGAIELAADSSFLAQEAGGSSAADAPRILEVPQLQETTADLSAQLSSALEFAKQRAAADAASRAPQAAKPAEGSFTSGFGARWGTNHNGVDIANAIGTAIRAVKDGTVIDAGPASGFGNWVRVKHDNGDITVYGHIATIDVSVGDRVTAGQKIAGMGNEGFSTGPHLHFEIHPNGSGPIDPVPWLRDLGIEI